MSVVSYGGYLVQVVTVIVPTLISKSQENCYQAIICGKFEKLFKKCRSFFILFSSSSSLADKQIWLLILEHNV